MNLATRALIGAGATGLAFLVLGPVSTITMGFLSTTFMVVLGVALAAQLLRYRQIGQRLYRPVYVRSSTVHQRVRFDDR